MIASELVDRLQRVAEDVFAGHQIAVAYVFGSRVAGRARPDSDLDVGYYRFPQVEPPALDLAVEMRLAQALSDATGVAVDLRCLAAAPLDLKGRVLEEGLRVYSGNETARVRIERELLARYHDYKAELAHLHRIRLRAIAEQGLA